METLLYGFDAAPAHAAYADLIADAQRPSGQVPGMVPSAGWGYNWGSGTPWDGSLVLIPWTLYRFTGDATPLRRLYPNMLRLLDYFDAVEDTDGLVKIGLGDWIPLLVRHAEPDSLPGILEPRQGFAKPRSLQRHRRLHVPLPCGLPSRRGTPRHDVPRNPSRLS